MILKDSLRPAILAGLIIFPLILCPLKQSSGQVSKPDFNERVNNFRNQNPREYVYLHTDREVYSPGDKLNFKAYVRNLYQPSVNSDSENLHLILVNQSGTLLQEKIFKIINGQSKGTFDLLNNTGEGEHVLIAWTNIMESGPVRNVFRKKIFIKQRMLPEVIIKLSAGETVYLPGDLAQVNVELTNIYGKPLKRKKFSYVASLNGLAFEAEDSKTDKTGKASLDIRLPASDEPGLVIIEVAVDIIGKTNLSSVLVPTSKTPVWVDFAPEGGLFIEGLETRIGFKSYDYLGNPIDIEGHIIDGNNSIVKTVKTIGQGFGSVALKADGSNPMKLRLTKPSGIDIDFSLPPVQTNGVQLILRSKDKDSLHFEVNTDIIDGAVSLHAVAEINGNLLFEKRFNLKENFEFSVPVNSDYAPGIVKVDLLGRQGEIVAHRSVYLHCDEPVLTKPIAGEEYSEGLPAKIAFTNGNNTQGDLNASYSLSVKDKLMAPEWTPVQDIMSCFLLGPEASYTGFPAGFLANPSEKEKEIIDNYMLFHLQNELDWANIKTGKKPGIDKSKNEFREELKSSYQTNDFESFISQIRTSQFFTKYYAQDSPDFFDYVAENRIQLERLGYIPVRLSSDKNVQQQLAQGQSIMNVLMSIKPYRIVNNKIVFRGNDSFNYQGGAIIVIDGVPRGTDPAVLLSISPYDVEKIRASANIADIQKYTGLNSTGVIEITTKTGESDGVSDGESIIVHPTIHWDPDIRPDSNGNFSVEIPGTPIQTTGRITIQGVGSDGRLYVWTSK